MLIIKLFFKNSSLFPDFSADQYKQSQYKHGRCVCVQVLKRRRSSTRSPQQVWPMLWLKRAVRDGWNAAPVTRLLTWRTEKPGSGGAAGTTSNTATSLSRTSWARGPTRTCAPASTCTTAMLAWRWGWTSSHFIYEIQPCLSTAAFTSQYVITSVLKAWALRWSLTHLERMLLYHSWNVGS